MAQTTFRPDEDISGVWTSTEATSYEALNDESDSTYISQNAVLPAERVGFRVGFSDGVLSSLGSSSISNVTLYLRSKYGVAVSRIVSKTTYDGNTNTGSVHTLTSSYVDYSTSMDNAPDSAAWTLEKLQETSFGVDVNILGRSSVIYVSELWIVVTYEGEEGEEGNKLVIRSDEDYSGNWCTYPSIKSSYEYVSDENNLTYIYQTNASLSFSEKVGLSDATLSKLNTTITNIRLDTRAKYVGATSQFQPEIIYSDNSVLGTQYILTDSFATYSFSITTAPNGSIWTEDILKETYFGPKIISVPTQSSIYVSKLQILATNYTILTTDLNPSYSLIHHWKCYPNASADTHVYWSDKDNSTYVFSTINSQDEMVYCSQGFDISGHVILEVDLKITGRYQTSSGTILIKSTYGGFAATQPVSLTTIWTEYSMCMASAPNGDSWTPTIVNTALYGVVTSDLSSESEVQVSELVVGVKHAEIVNTILNPDEDYSGNWETCPSATTSCSCLADDSDFTYIYMSNSTLYSEMLGFSDVKFARCSDSINYVSFCNTSKYVGATSFVTPIVIYNDNVYVATQYELSSIFATYSIIMASAPNGSVWTRDILKNTYFGIKTSSLPTLGQINVSDLYLSIDYNFASILRLSHKLEIDKELVVDISNILYLDKPVVYEISNLIELEAFDTQRLYNYSMLKEDKGVFDPSWWNTAYFKRQPISFSNIKEDLTIGKTVDFKLFTGYEKKFADNGVNNESAPHVFYYKDDTYERTYICWLAQDPDVKNYQIYVTYLNHATGTFVENQLVIDSGTDYDSHFAANILVDSNGYIYLFYGCHHSPLKLVKSDSPHDITSFSNPISGGGDIDGGGVWKSITYPVPIESEVGDIYVFHRNNIDRGAFCKSSDGGVTWSDAQFFVYYHDSYYESQSAVYIDSVKYINNRIHMVINFCEKYGTDNLNRMLTYVYTDNFLTWYTVTGTVVGYTSSSPTTASLIDFVAIPTSQHIYKAATKAFPSPPYYTGNTALTSDPLNNPYFLAYSASLSREPCDLHLVKRNGLNWATLNLSQNVEDGQQQWYYRAGGNIYLDNDIVYVYSFVLPTLTEEYYGAEKFRWRGTEYGKNWSVMYQTKNTAYGAGQIGNLPKVYDGKGKELVYGRCRDLYWTDDSFYPYIRSDGNDIRIIRHFGNNVDGYTSTELPRLPDRFDAEDTTIYFKMDATIQTNWHHPDYYNRYYVYYSNYSADVAPHTPASVFYAFENFENYPENTNLVDTDRWSGVPATGYFDMSERFKINKYDDDNYGGGHPMFLISGSKNCYISETGAQMDSSKYDYVEWDLELSDHLVEFWIWFGDPASYPALFLELYNTNTSKGIRVGQSMISIEDNLYAKYQLASHNYLNWVTSTLIANQDQYHKFLIKINSDGVSAWCNGINIVTDNMEITSANKLRLKIQSEGWDCGFFDFILIKNYFKYAPVLTLGTVEGDDNWDISRFTQRTDLNYQRLIRYAHNLDAHYADARRLSNILGLEREVIERLVNYLVLEYSDTERFANVLIGDKEILKRISNILLGDKELIKRLVNRLNVDLETTIRLGNILIGDKKEIKRLSNILNVDKIKVLKVIHKLITDKEVYERVNNLLCLEMTKTERISGLLEVDKELETSLSNVLVLWAESYTRISHIISVDKELTERVINLLVMDKEDTTELANLLEMDKEIYERVFNIADTNKALTIRLSQYLDSNKEVTARLMQLLDVDKIDTTKLAQLLIFDKEVITKLYNATVLDKINILRLSEDLNLDKEIIINLANIIVPDKETYERFSNITDVNRAKIVRLASYLDTNKITKIRLMQLMDVDKIETIRLAQLVFLERENSIRLNSIMVLDKEVEKHLSNILDIDKITTEELSHILESDKENLIRLMQIAIMDKEDYIRLSNKLDLHYSLIERIAHEIAANKELSIRFSNIVRMDKANFDRLANVLGMVKENIERVVNTAELNKEVIKRLTQFLKINKEISIRFSNTLSVDYTDYEKLANTIVLDKKNILRFYHLIESDKNTFIRFAHKIPVDVAHEEKLAHILDFDKELFQRVMNTLDIRKELVIRLNNYLNTNKVMTSNLANMLNVDKIDTIRLVNTLINDKELFIKLSHIIVPEKTVTERLANIIDFPGEYTRRLAQLVNLHFYDTLRLSGTLSLDKINTIRLSHILSKYINREIRLANLIAFTALLRSNILKLRRLSLARSSLGNEEIKRSYIGSLIVKNSSINNEEISTIKVKNIEINNSKIDNIFYE